MSNLIEQSRVVRPAIPSDAETIYALMGKAFGETYIVYTIYQAPQSIEYIRYLIRQNDFHYFFVLCQSNQPVGYYHAFRRETDFFLNYVAVLPGMQGNGLGQVLLEHYEDKGWKEGCTRLVLDVFDSNAIAKKWYLSHGYQIESFSYLTRLSMWNQNIVRPSIGLTYDVEQWNRALQEEQEHGFSKIKCSSGPIQLTVGLIAGNVCRLMDYSNISLDDAIISIIRMFGSHRRVLVISSVHKISSDWQVLSSEKVIRLFKVQIEAFT
jgi:ribosomal protein S18 acetylase RimI-like enzyme